MPLTSREAAFPTPPSVGLRVFYALLLIAAAVVAIDRGLDQTTGGDFNVFWAAGGRFAADMPLYVSPPGERIFIYPPFAAFLFQALHWLPLVPAAVVFSLANVALMIALYALTVRIVTRTMQPRHEGRWPFVAAIVLAHSYLLNNMNLVQVNVIVAVLVLLGVKLVLDRRESLAALPLVAAAAFKVMPILFVAWLVIRRWRTAWPGLLAATAVVVALPMVQRGPAQGVRDLREYYQAFLQDFQGGRVVADYTNQNIASAVERMSRPVLHRERLDYRWMSLSESGARGVRNALIGAVLVALFGGWLALAARGRPIGAWEVATGFLAWHLVSGITWKSHLVTFLFLFAVFLAAPVRRWPPVPRALGWLTLAVIVVTSFIGRDIVGRTAHYYIGGWSFLTWMMLLMFGLATWRVLRREPIATSTAPAG